MKKCIHCGEDKSLDHYYTHPMMADGHLNKCKDCVRAYMKKRHHLKMKDEAWREAERERSRKKFRDARDAGRDWAVSSPPGEQRRAHSLLGSALKCGRVTPPEVCERCGHDFSDFRREAHHADYSRPLDVEWLCARCHRRHHRRAA